MALQNVYTTLKKNPQLLDQNIMFSNITIHKIYYDRLEFEYDNFFFQVRCSFHIDFLALNQATFVLVS